MATKKEIPEVPEERQIFNKAAKFNGGPLMAIASNLETWWLMEGTRGSYRAWLAIMSNECAKAHRELRAARREIKRLSKSHVAKNAKSVKR